ncbi:MAG: T9SS type A sorting domain-containing protein [Candidatus Marinimicrobia bacterium]|nr:T9SS type A sorting domain-containing protein [Candidatus Neomarinimicrobiota bacterium]
MTSLIKRYFILSLFLTPLILTAASDTLNVTITVQHANRIESTIPHDFKLYDPYPNPFNPSVTLHLDVPKNIYGNVIIYDLTGRKIANLFEGNFQPGTHQWLWHPQNLASGIYILSVVTEEWQAEKKMVYLK